MYSDLIELLAEGRAEEYVLDSLPFAVYATDAEGRLKYYNATAARLSGKEPELGTDQWCVNLKLFHTDGTPMVRKEYPMAVALKEGRMVKGAEAIAERPDGERIWIKAYSSPLKNRKGKIVGAINLLMNITNQKETKAQIRRKEEDIIDFFENAAVGLHLTKADGTVKRANQAILDMLGYTHEEFVGHHVTDFHADQEVVGKIMQKLSAGEELHDLEVRLRHKDGSIRHALVSSNGYNKDGEFIHTRCITRDITRRKQAEAELADLAVESERMERLYEAIISATPDLVYIFDLNYRFIFANDALMEMWGCTKDEYMGKSLQEIGYKPWHAEMHEREIDQVIATKQPIRGDVSFPHATLGERIYDYIFVPVLNENGEVEAVAGTTRDVTERKQAEEALRESEEKYRTLFEKLKSLNETLEERVEERTEALLSYQTRLRSLASQLSRAEENQRHQLAAELHDNLGQLLAVGKMRVDMLHKNLDSDHSSRMISELKEVMDDAIAYTRGLMTNLKPPPSLNNDLLTGLNWVAERLKRRGLKVTIEDDGQPKPLNEEVKSTIIRNVRELLFNVLKHTSEEEASVQLKKADDRLKISVKDGGEGFDMNSWEWLSDESGGYGLFNIREQLDLLGGDIDIQSKLDKGTTVTLQVPLQEEDYPDGEHKADQHDTNTNKSDPAGAIKVLLVDDHQMVRKGLRKIIEEQDDIRVTGEAANGEEAIKLAGETSPDIILMDINLPGIDGIEATQRIVNSMPDVRVIGLSLHDETEVVADVKSAGASAYLSKTEAFESLVETIRAEASALKK